MMLRIKIPRGGAFAPLSSHKLLEGLAGCKISGIRHKDFTRSQANNVLQTIYFGKSNKRFVPLTVQSLLNHPEMEDHEPSYIEEMVTLLTTIGFVRLRGSRLMTTRKGAAAIRELSGRIDIGS